MTPRGAPAATFDTALTLPSLEAIRAGAARWAGYLPKAQLPAGGTSYAGHISTTGWVRYALLAMGPEGK